jgi:hypothetical protein
MRENEETGGTELHLKPTRSRHRLAHVNAPIAGLALLLPTGIELVAVANILRG